MASTLTTALNTRPVPTSLLGGPHLVPYVGTVPVPPLGTYSRPGTFTVVGSVASNGYFTFAVAVGESGGVCPGTVAKAVVLLALTVH